MVIRAASFGDMPAIYGMMREMHARSKYAADADIHEETMRSLVMDAIQRHGRQNNGGTNFDLYVENGEPTAFMIGALQRLYLIGNRLEAQDLFLFAKEGASPRAAASLISSYVSWAEGCKKVASIKLSFTDALGVDADRLGALYERKGFSRHGAIFEKVTAA